MHSWKDKGGVGRVRGTLRKPFSIYAPCLLDFGRPREDMVQHSTLRNLKGKKLHTTVSRQIKDRDP